jgi:hypothetical protein
MASLLPKLRDGLKLDCIQIWTKGQQTWKREVHMTEQLLHMLAQG